MHLHRIFTTFAISALLWGASSVGYFWLLPPLGTEDGYNDAPIIFASFYAAWSAFAFVLCRGAYSRQVDFEHPRRYLVPVLLMTVALVIFVTGILPKVPAMMVATGTEPAEHFFASTWYFLPKSAEVLFQQLLVAAIIFDLSALALPIGLIALIVASTFGAFHFSLVFVYENFDYVWRFAVAATLFGAIAPYLLLRLRLGFLYSFGLHWAFYAVLAIRHIQNG